MQAAQIAMHAGILPNGSVRFWRAGAWHDTLMFGFEIHDEPSVPTLPTQVLKLHREAALALRAGDPASSERLLLQALTLAPDEPSLLNNLGATYGALGRGQEAEALAERLFAKHPDYLFARTNLVAYLVAEGKIEEAQALIDPLLQRTRLHISEFGAVMGSQINIFIAQGNQTAAQTWLDMWQQADPDHPHIQLYQSRLLFARRRRRARKQ
jgi:tetratricopeptide (TPR) repeat protein